MRSFLQRILRLFLCSVSALSLTVGISLAQIVEADENLIVRSVRIDSSNQRTIDFEDLSGERANFSLLTIVDLSSSIGAWSVVPDAVYEEIVPGYHRFTIPASQSTSNFFRVVSSGLTEDFDHDGLTTTEEEALGTNDTLADTDSDGFSDSIEVDNGTDPLDASSIPPFDVLTTVSFAQTTLKITETSGAVNIPIVFTDTSFNGFVTYEISSLTNALTEGANRDFSTASNVVRILDGVGSISLNLVDDDIVEKIETIVIDLVRGDSGTYRLNTNDRLSIQVFDNDSYWSGYMRNDEAEMNFRMLLIEQNGSLSGMITRPPKVENDTISIGGSFPAGDWDLTASKTADSFYATTEHIPINSSRLFDISMERTLQFEATPPADPNSPTAFYDFRETRIAGTVRETLESTNPNDGYLTKENDFYFVLIKDIPQLEDIEIPLEPAP